MVGLSEIEREKKAERRVVAQNVQIGVGCIRADVAVERSRVRKRGARARLEARRGDTAVRAAERNGCKARGGKARTYVSGGLLC